MASWFFVLLIKTLSIVSFAILLSEHSIIFPVTRLILDILCFAASWDTARSLCSREIKFLCFATQSSSRPIYLNDLSISALPFFWSTLMKLFKAMFDPESIGKENFAYLLAGRALLWFSIAAALSAIIEVDGLIPYSIRSAVKSTTFYGDLMKDASLVPAFADLSYLFSLLNALFTLIIFFSVSGTYAASAG